MKEETEIDEIPENFSPVEMIEAIKRHRVEFVSPARCCTRCPSHVLLGFLRDSSS